MLASSKQWLLTGNPYTESQGGGCLCCGECCRSFGSHLHASDHDLQRWQREERTDLPSRVNRLGWIWVNPETKEIEEVCPFIQQINADQSVCATQKTKPGICRDYPTLAHGKRCLKGLFLEHYS